MESGRRRSPRTCAAALLGVAVGLIYAGSAAVLKAVSNILSRNPLGVLASWQLYTVIALGLLGLLLNQLAFQAGPIAASLPATSTVDPLASIAIGVAVFDERIPRLPGSGALLVVLLVVLGLAVIQLVRTSPQITTDTPAARST